MAKDITRSAHQLPISSRSSRGRLIKQESDDEEDDSSSCTPDVEDLVHRDTKCAPASSHAPVDEPLDDHNNKGTSTSCSTLPDESLGEGGLLSCTLEANAHSKSGHPLEILDDDVGTRTLAAESRGDHHADVTASTKSSILEAESYLSDKDNYASPRTLEAETPLSDDHDDVSSCTLKAETPIPDDHDDASPRTLKEETPIPDDHDDTSPRTLKEETPFPDDHDDVSSCTFDAQSPPDNNDNFNNYAPGAEPLPNPNEEESESANWTNNDGWKLKAMRDGTVDKDMSKRLEPSGSWNQGLQKYGP